MNECTCKSLDGQKIYHTGACPILEKDFDCKVQIKGLPDMSDERVKDVINHLRIIADGIEKTDKRKWAQFTERILLKKK